MVTDGLRVSAADKHVVDYVGAHSLRQCRTPTSAAGSLIG